MSELRLLKPIFNALELNPLAKRGQGSIGGRFRGMILLKLMAKVCNLAVGNTQQRYLPPLGAEGEGGP